MTDDNAAPEVPASGAPASDAGPATLRSDDNADGVPTEPGSKVLAPPIVALAGWVLPGLGYWLIGERARALWAGVTILALFIGGVFVSGVRVIDPPGYNAGQRVLYRTEAGQVWALRSRPVGTLLTKPAYLGQVMTGPVALAGTWGSLSAAKAGIPRTSAKLESPVSLGMAVAGMLNLLVLVDSASRASRHNAAVDAAHAANRGHARRTSA